ncbi:MAG: hypothetical protein DRN37_04135 [Thermoplasmata archaeon]|nr:MAG: hypothetical protein DRN37_04135 [Thermoplasmata archaeon]
MLKCLQNGGGKGFMNRYLRLPIFLFVLILALTACFQLKHPKNRVQYYILEYDPPPVTRPSPLPAAIRVERFSVAPMYNTDRMVYRDRSFRRDEYVYHKWRANPADMVAYFLSRDIRDSGLFRAVLPSESRLAASYILEGSVDDFFEQDREDEWQAVLTLSITIVSADEPDVSSAILYQKTYRARKTCRQKNPRGLAEAMSLAMAEISKNIIGDLYDCLRERKD